MDTDSLHRRGVSPFILYSRSTCGNPRITICAACFVSEYYLLVLWKYRWTAIGLRRHVCHLP